ncbi:MAG: hypothetical protein IJ529_05890 [Alphaproteobacteria bacterium]|nr:hypothetical protein [Alphaproteobacteria bacterium]MBQ9235642.1 hypothetical protein [Alphaproteobacteria bacterium]
MANIELIVNLIIICLLIPMIIYAYNLNRSLKDLRQNQNSLAKLVAALNEATFKAENSIPKLKTATENSSHGLKEVVDNAKELKNDLLFINERADSLADRLENVISSSRNMPAPAAAKAEPLPPQDDRAMAEMELLKALRAIK